MLYLLHHGSCSLQMWVSEAKQGILQMKGCIMDSQSILKQPTRSGRLLVRIAAKHGKKKARQPVCDGRCLRAKVCTMCLRKRQTQVDQRSARADKRDKLAAAAVRVTHLEIQAKEEQKNVTDDDSESAPYYPTLHDTHTPFFSQ
jgi:hypothetical protein